MREIMFRGKRKDNGEWVYGGYYQGVMPETNNPLSIDNARIKTIIIQDGIYYHIIPESVGQFTGLKDKNKKEIYEGDMFGSIKQLRCVVKRLDNSVYVIEFLDSRIESWSLPDPRIKQSKIIGNITDNPELLEDK